MGEYHIMYSRAPNKRARRKFSKNMTNEYTALAFYAKGTQKKFWRKKKMWLKNNGGFYYSGLAFFLHRPGVKKEYPEIY